MCHLFLHRVEGEPVSCVLLLPLGIRLLVLEGVLNDDVDIVGIFLVVGSAAVLPLRLIRPSYDTHQQ